ncbi:MAG: ADP-ribosylglycohydrolase family protein [Clostridia bacterium]|nr:ADP-ribosylglycohydrolase family protein [Clostridia bacterium]
MDIKLYRNKVMGCWLGKNIGGSLGTPYEGIRGVFDIDYYTHDISQGVLPNDDLDLQLVWLNAAEKYGKCLDSEILGEYWLSYIVANPSEYGAGKNNMSMGILPPLSGWYNNPYRNSCGSFIRSEIWACLMPGHPELAVTFAYEDAIVDHSDEGVYAEIFCAAIESAAFSENHTETLIEIGLSFIPDNCAVALAAKTAIECYKKKMTWKQARKVILQTVPGDFGHVPPGEKKDDDIPAGDTGFNAPSNIGLMLVGWLFGEGDFSKSICIAVGCGEDTDCTGATLGAILGIINGADAIPQKWLDPIGDEIKTVCVDLTKWEVITIPENVNELTERTSLLMPSFMGKYCNILAENGVDLMLFEGTELMDHGVYKGRVYSDFNYYYKFKDILKTQPFGVKKKSVAFDVTLDYVNGISIQEGISKPIRLHFENNLVQQQWVTVTWHFPEEWTVFPGKETVINLSQRHGISAMTEAMYSFTPHSLDRGKYDLLLEIKSNGKLSTMYLPVTFILNPRDQ